ncbi:MAG TPA: efflux RND transporter periplasmic adaptor subunit, partial [Stellaceae bacterium]|nr:efflux RND transporter periplasmic adaptor subunit [Stellaceae bacterium]
EQAFSRRDDRLPRPTTPSLRDRFRWLTAILHTRSYLHLLVQINILHSAVHRKGWMRWTCRHADPARQTEPVISPRGRQCPMPRLQILTAALIAASLTSCDRKPPPAALVRPVRTVTVGRGAEGEILSLTGQIRAKDQVSLAFRLDGRMMKRPVNVGDILKPGEIVAELDPQNQLNALRTAQGNLATAEAAMTQARLAFGRQQQLLPAGWTSRAKYDEAQQLLVGAAAQVYGTRAQVSSAEDQLSYTALTADAPGVVTATGAEPGEVVRAGQTIVNVARQGGRDAVFDVSEQLMRTAPRDPVVQIVLTNDPSVRAIGRVREVSPQADSATRTFQVKVGIIDPPPAMQLGSTVTGSIKLAAPAGFPIPPSALTEADGRPAVWVVDARSQTVSLRGVEVARYDPDDVVVSQGLEPGEIVVTAGAQTLHPAQKIRLLGAAS